MVKEKTVVESLTQVTNDELMKEIQAVRADIKALKLNMMQMQQLKVAMGTRV
jgi:hypothetical protein